MPNYYLIGTLRVKYNLTQVDMANILHVGLTTYKNYETNKRLMSLNELNLLSIYFKVSLNYLLGLTNNPKSFNINKKVDYKMLTLYLIHVRKHHHYTQKSLAKELNIHENSISRYETTPRTVSIYYLYLFAKKFNLSIDYICNKTTKKEIL